MYEEEPEAEVEAIYQIITDLADVTNSQAGITQKLSELTSRLREVGFKQSLKTIPAQDFDA